MSAIDPNLTGIQGAISASALTTKAPGDTPDSWFDQATSLFKRVQTRDLPAGWLPPNTTLASTFAGDSATPTTPHLDSFKTFDIPDLVPQSKVMQIFSSSPFRGLEFELYQVPMLNEGHHELRVRSLREDVEHLKVPDMLVGTYNRALIDADFGYHSPAALKLMTVFAALNSPDNLKAGAPESSKSLGNPWDFAVGAAVDMVFGSVSAYAGSLETLFNNSVAMVGNSKAALEVGWAGVTQGATPAEGASNFLNSERRRQYQESNVLGGAAKAITDAGARAVGADPKSAAYELGGYAPMLLLMRVGRGGTTKGQRGLPATSTTQADILATIDKTPMAKTVEIPNRSAHPVVDAGQALAAKVPPATSTTQADILATINNTPVAKVAKNVEIWQPSDIELLKKEAPPIYRALQAKLDIPNRSAHPVVNAAYHRLLGIERPVVSLGTPPADVSISAKAGQAPAAEGPMTGPRLIAESASRSEPDVTATPALPQRTTDVASAEAAGKLQPPNVYTPESHMTSEVTGSTTESLGSSNISNGYSKQTKVVLDNDIPEITRENNLNVTIGEVGLSSRDTKYLMSTSACGPCTGVSIYNPNNQQGLVTHIVTSEQIPSLWKHMDMITPDGDYSPLEVTLVSTLSNSKETSIHEMSKIIELKKQFSERNIDPEVIESRCLILDLRNGGVYTDQHTDFFEIPRENRPGHYQTLTETLKRPNATPSLKLFEDARPEEQKKGS